MSKIISVEEAAKLIKDNDFVATTATSGLAGLPEELLVSIGDRYKKEQSNLWSCRLLPWYVKTDRRG
jgi:propionate CoA-transferase